MLMIQIVNKFMLLDIKIGQCLLDDCVYFEQVWLMVEVRVVKFNDFEVEVVQEVCNSLGIMLMVGK